MSDPNDITLNYLLHRFDSYGEIKILNELFEVINSNEINCHQKSEIFKVLNTRTLEIFSYLGIERIDDEEYLDTVIIMRILDMIQKWMYGYQDLNKESRIKIEKLKLSELSRKINMIIKINSTFENKLYNDIDFFFVEFNRTVDRLYDQTIYRVK